jgi:hypothetical protein
MNGKRNSYPGHGLYRSTWVNLKNYKKIFEILIFYMKTLENNSCEYKVYML